MSTAKKLWFWWIQVWREGATGSLPIWIVAPFTGVVIVMAGSVVSTTVTVRTTGVAAFPAASLSVYVSS